MGKEAAVRLIGRLEDGSAIVQSNGAPAGQTVFHLHVHIIPRFEGAKLAGHGHQNKADMPDLEALAKQIAAAIE